MADWQAEGFLEGLDDDGREDRVRLLDWLEGRGFSLDELRDGHRHGLLPFLPARRVVLGGPPTTSVRAAAEKAGLELEVVEAMRRAMGLPSVDPDAGDITDLEAVAVALPAGYRSLGFSDEQMLAITRVLGRGLAAAAQVMRSAALEQVLEVGVSERDLAERYERTVAEVVPSLAPMLDVLLRLHLRNMLQTEAVETTERRNGQLPGARQVAVAFADLVGFTRMGEQVAPEELSAVADRLGALAGDVAVQPVSLVKQLGDGVMLVSPDPATLLSAVFRLLDRAEEAGLPQLRVGVASGLAQPSGGDWFGRPVNLASRLSGIARANSVLCTDEVRSAAGDGAARWSHAGSRSVKGVHGGVRLHRARPPEAAS